MKNVVFIPNVDLGNNRNQAYHYSIKSWQKWCDKNNVQLIEWKDVITDPSYLKVTLQRYWVHDILEHNGIDYDQVLIVDADTIIHPEAPNFFHETNGKFSVVVNNGCYEWTTRSITQWGNALFPDQPKIKTWKYFNGGFQITNKTHKPFYDKVKEYYLTNIDKINMLSAQIKAGTDQTIINYLCQINNIDINYLPECYNLQDLFRKNLLHIPGHAWFTDELHFLNAGWIYHFNAIPENTRHVSYWLKRTYDELYSNKSNIPKFSPISLDYFLDMEVANGGISKQILNLNGKLKTVREIVNYWKTAPDPDLRPDNWQYYNCMIAGFRKNVANHHDLGWDNMTREYYQSLDIMTDDEIKIYLENTPVDFDNGFIKHSYHRAYAMIGRLIRDEKYIPFYMETTKIYNTPTKIDNIHRSKPVTDKIKLLHTLDALGIDRNEYCLTQSSILSIMGIRDNDDLDIIISSNLRSQNIEWPMGVEVFSANYDKFMRFGATSDDHILRDFCVDINGYKFLEPRFYFSRKNMNTLRDHDDWELVRKFFDSGKHLGYPFNFEFYKWGVPYVDTVQLDDLELDNLVIIKDKFNREVNGINHGRKIYYSQSDQTYIKIFNPTYCRLTNFQSALESGVLNGLIPALYKLIYDGNVLVGYITHQGTPIADNDHEFDKIPTYVFNDILQNCKKRNKVYYDIVPQNIVRLDNGQYSLIDLESVYDLDSNLHDIMKQHNAICKPENLLQYLEQL
jgi:hypothetical protein